MDSYIRNLPIPPIDEDAAASARARWDAIAKPLGSLGMLEDAIVQIAALTGDSQVCVRPCCVAVLCADNGVVAQGVAQSDPKVSALIAGSVAQGKSSVCRMAAASNIECVAVDMGLFEQADAPKMLDRRIAAGTRDFTLGPAMTREQTLQAIRSGADLVGELAKRGYRLVATGEMGIGNTTTSTAIACAFTGMEPALLVGRGAGLSDEGLARKVDAIRRALEVNDPNPDDPLDVLAKLGGFDIAGMCGMFLGGAVHRIPVVIDGFISTVAAYCAMRLREDCKAAMLPSHLSAEPAAAVLLDRMGLRPMLHADMRLGEGTGAVCLVPLLDMALSLYSTGPTYADFGIAAGNGKTQA